MENSSLDNCITLLDKPAFLKMFIYTYVSSAVSLATHSPPLSNFYSDLEDNVYDNLGISQEVVYNLHHPFHWAFFNDPSSETNSPFRYIQPEHHNETVRIKLEGSTVNSREQLTDYIFTTYSDLFTGKLEYLINQNKSTEIFG